MVYKPKSEPSAAETPVSSCCTDGGCCTAATQNLASRPVTTDVRLFSALANETRYAALRLLAAADDEVCACELTPELDVSQSTVSNALSALHQVGLVDRRKDGRWRYYSVTDRGMAVRETADTLREARS